MTLPEEPLAMLSGRSRFKQSEEFFVEFHASWMHSQPGKRCEAQPTHLLHLLDVRTVDLTASTSHMSWFVFINYIGKL